MPDTISPMSTNALALKVIVKFPHLTVTSKVPALVDEGAVIAMVPIDPIAPLQLVFSMHS